MTIEDKVSLVARNTQELISTEELTKVFEEKPHPKAYIGFEVSGYMHLGTGIICAIIIRYLRVAGFQVAVFLADWHSLVNNNLGGDLDAIRRVGKEYFQTAFEAAGVSGSGIKFVWSSELVDHSDYWKTVIQIAKSTTMSRILRCLPIMGRSEEVQGEMESAFLFYPPMQCADIFTIEGGLDLAYGGMDQRRIHVLCREVAPKLNRTKPVILHTPLLMGLKGPGERMDSHAAGDDGGGLNEAKMSKSDPSSAIFTHDSPEEIQTKIKNAHCPPKEIINNPVIDIAKLIHFPFVGRLKVERKPKFGGDIEFTTFDELATTYQSGTLHPMDLKTAIANSLIELLKPSRTFFNAHPEKLDIVKSFKITK